MSIELKEVLVKELNLEALNFALMQRVLNGCGYQALRVGNSISFKASGVDGWVDRRMIVLRVGGNEVIEKIKESYEAQLAKAQEAAKS